MPRSVRSADGIALTGSSLIDHLLEGPLVLCRPGPVVLILGPGTLLAPLLFEFAVTILSGSQVCDERAALRSLGQGASFRQRQGVCLLNRISNQEERSWNSSCDRSA
ncbi:MAG: hypothetical protein JXB85_16565 [Anaerolineales bacterium]|nr:hypothetical protein [Anaerolineales bacterium]